MSCDILDIINPEWISVRKKSDQKSFQDLSSRLFKFYSTASSSGSHIKFQEMAYVAVKTSNHDWTRARIDKVGIDDNLVELTLIDLGLKATVSGSYMRPLLEEFVTMRPLSTVVRLVDLLPSGGGGKWTNTACDYLGDLIASSGWQVELECLQRDDGDEICPVKILVKMNNKEVGPLDPDMPTHIDVRERLISCGLAIPIKTKHSSLKCLRAFSICDVKQCSDSELSVSSRLDYSSDLISHDLRKTALISYPANATTCSSSFKWPSYKLPPKSTFNAVGTHLDYDCTLYIREQEEGTKVLNIINKILNHKYMGSVATDDDMYWNPGDACIVKYCVDQSWHRGEVLEVKSNGMILVKFIDYGDSQLCFPKSLRKKLYCADILPVYCVHPNTAERCPIDW